MSKFKIDNIKPLLNDEFLNFGIYLHIVHATTVPPHLVLSINGKVFSLSTKGPSLDGNMEQTLRFLKAKKVKTLFVKLKLPLLVTPKDLLEKIRLITSAYPRVDIGVATCLTPIKDFCSDVYATNINDVQLIFDLLPKLSDQELVEEIFHLHLEKDLTEGALLMDKYSVFEVNECIYSSYELKRA
jgi:hypothetical protein